MSKLVSDLIEIAGKHARNILVETHHALMPTWVLIDAKNKMTIVGTPWQNDVEKEFFAKAMRQEMRKRKIVAYSFISEAWKAVVPGDTDLSEVRASDRPDKQEIVIALASDGDDQELRAWGIKRDWHERVIELSPLPVAEGIPEGWMCEMLKKSR